MASVKHATTATGGDVAGKIGQTAWNEDHDVTVNCDDLQGTFTSVNHNLTPVVPTAVGSRYWNEAKQTTSLVTSSTTTLDDGEELSPLFKNGDTQTHLNGQPVYISTGAGNYPVVKLASASSELTSYTIALATQDVLHTGNGRGKYTVIGTVSSFPISNVKATSDSALTWSEGDYIYLSSELGKLTKTRPVAPDHAVAIGFITAVSGSNISIFVHPAIGYELDELHNVDTSKSKVVPVAADYFFVRDSADSDIWKLISFSNFKSAIASFTYHLFPGSANLNGAATEPLLTSMTSVYNSWDELQYNDTTVNSAIWLIPSAITRNILDAPITVRIRWICENNNTGDVKWSVQMVGLTTGDGIDPVFPTAHTAVTTTYDAVSGKINTTDITFTPTATECTAGDSVYLKISRMASDIADTLVGNAGIVDAGVFQ